MAVDVHELIDRWLNDVHGQVQAIQLLIPGCNSQPPTWVEIEEVTPNLDFEISILNKTSDPDALIEQVSYETRERDSYTANAVFVYGFPIAPAVPELPE